MGSNASPRSITTRLAEMTMVEPGFLEQRFHAGAKLDLGGFQENKEARFRLCGDSPYLMLSVMPSDIDFEVRITTTDHFAPERGKDLLIALAVVAQDNVAEMVTKLYFSYFPQTFRLCVFNGEDEARAWLMLQREEVLGSEKAGA